MNHLAVLILVTMGQFDDAKAKRAGREKAVARVGAAGRSFVETYREEAVAAILACTPNGGRDLVGFFRNGRLDMLPSPQGALFAVANGGNPVVKFIIDHGEELQDADRFNAFCGDPMTFVMNIKSLDEGAADLRWRREFVRMRRRVEEHDKKMGLIVIGVMAVIVLVIWRRRRSY